MALTRYSSIESRIGDAMKKIFATALIALTVAGLSGCFPVFIPVGDHHGHHRGHHRGW